MSIHLPIGFPRTARRALAFLLLLAWVGLRPQISWADAPNLLQWGYIYDNGPSDLPSNLRYTQAASGYYHQLALRSDGKVIGWGYSEFIRIPTLPPGINYTEVSAGLYHSLALRSDGEVVGFGWDQGPGELTAPPLPNGITYTMVAAGNAFSLALSSDGQVAGFGANYAGQTTIPPLPDGVTYTQLAAGDSHGLALRSDGQVVGFGDDSYGQTDVPPLPDNTTYIGIAAGQFHSLALRSDGQVVAFGNDSSGQIDVPLLDSGLTYIQVAAGWNHSLLLRSDHQAVSFGENNSGQVDVPGLDSGKIYLQVAAGGETSLGIFGGYVTVTMNGSSARSVLVHRDFVDPGATAVDLDGNSLEVTTNGTVDVDTPGVYTITYSASDDSGRTDSQTRTITVLSDAPPIYAAMMPSYAQQAAYANAVLNEPIEVWGRVWGGLGPFDYTLDFGDGQSASGVNVDSSQMAYYVGALHNYASSGSKTVTLNVTDNGSGSNIFRQSVVRVIVAPTHDNRVNIAIEKANLFLYKNYTAWDDNRIYWLNASDNTGIGSTAFALLAFEENGHLPGHDYQEDIYANLVQRGLNTLASQAASQSMAGRGELDSNGDGVAVTIGSDTYADCLSANAFIMAFTSTNEANKAVIPDGVGPFAGTSYLTLVANMIDALYGSQHSDGAWHYSVDPNNPDSGADGSTHQWPNIVMLTAQERWGFPILSNAIAQSMTSFESLQGNDGGCGYSSAGSWENDGKTGGLLAGYTLGNRFPGDDRVDRGLQYLGDHWNADPDIGGADAGWAGDFYAMYGVKKGLQLQGITTIAAPDGPRDWFQDVSSWLLGDTNLVSPSIAPNYRSAANYAFGQNADGSWTSTSGFISSSSQSAAITTADAVLIMTKAVTKPLPIAVIAAIPDQSARNPIPFTLNGSGSYHLDPNSSIVEYLWILGGGNNLDWTHPDAAGPVVSVNPLWIIPDTYTVTLRVKDNATPPNYAIATRTVNVSYSDVAPVAVAIPPNRQPATYAAKIGSPIPLDGSASYDPDGDTITAYAWDLNGDGIYGDAADAALDSSGNSATGVTATITFSSNYNGQVGLQVTANGKSSSNVTSVDVYASPSNLAVTGLAVSEVIPGVGLNVHAVLTNDLASGLVANNVSVKFYNGNPFTTGSQIGTNYNVNLPIGASGIIDATLPTPGLTNFDLYVYLDANNTIPEWSEEDNLASVTITAVLPNRPPFASSSIPDQDATVGMAFAFAFDPAAFTDPDLDILTYAASGLPSGIDFVPETRTFAGTATNAGNYLVTLVASDGGNPALTATNTFQINVAKGAATVFLANLEQVYTGNPRAVTASTTPTNLAVVLTYDGSASPPVAAGSYAVVATVSDDNFSGVLTQSLTVGKASLLVSAKPKTRLYGSTNPVLTSSYSGFVDGDTISIVAGAPGLSTTATAQSPVGSYSINASGGTLSAANYAFAFSNSLLTVTPAPLVVTADNQTREYGADNPALTVSFSGLTGGDTPSSLGGVPGLFTTATNHSPAGSYNITTSQGTLTALNYDVSFVDGNLTVTKATLKAIAADQSRTYGAANPDLTISYTGFVDGEGPASLDTLPTATAEADLTSPIGSYPITLSGGTSPNYTVALVNGTLTIGKAPLIVTANDATRAYGTSNPVFTASIAGLKNNDPISTVCTSAALATSPAGTYPIVPNEFDFSGISSNYVITLTTGKLTVTAALTLTASPAFYIIGSESALVDTNALLADGGSLNFDGARLLVSINGAAGDQDQVTIASEGFSTGQIASVVTNVFYGGSQFGSFAEESATNHLTFVFNNNATSEALTALLRKVTFASTSTNTTARDAQVILEYSNITLTATRSIIPDHVPVAVDDLIQVAQGITITIPISLVLTNDFDPDGDLLNVVDSGPISTNGASITLVGTNLVYRPTASQTHQDSFTYVIDDQKGGRAVGTITLRLEPLNILEVDASDRQGSGATIEMIGTPGTSYEILTSEDLVHWTILKSVSAGPTGAIEFVDAESKNYLRRFYRALAK